jgi:HPt (histidine-containing phosphotransfer) domain-containing protein
MTNTSKRERWALSGALLEFAEDGDFHLVRSIIDVFLSDTEDKVESLKQAVLASDSASAQRIAHSLKGAARQLGILRLADDAEHLEHARLEHASPVGIDSATFSLLVMEIVGSWREAKQLVIDTRDALPATSSDPDRVSESETSCLKIVSAGNAATPNTRSKPL